MMPKNRQGTRLGAAVSILFSIGAAALLILLALIYQTGKREPFQPASPQADGGGGVRLPVRWGSLGQELTRSGVIDRERFLALAAQRGTGEEARFLLDGEHGEYLTATPENAGLLLNLFWALGLGNENEILTAGPMVDGRYGGAGRFASTGGWTLASGSAMEHYGRHRLVTLTDAEQAMVERVAQSVYRPCCDNPTHFPDCNHGMAMLGLLELLASQGRSEAEIYRIAFAMNTLWFPDEYEVLGAYFAKQGIASDSVDPKVALSASYSSASGFRRVQAALQQFEPGSGGSCSA